MNGDNDGGTLSSAQAGDGARRAAGSAEAGGATRTVLADDPTTRYLGGVRSALADLPASEVAEILDDVRAHLTDLAGELGTGADLEALTARLGTPATYAAELRAAAGYPPAPAPQKEAAQVVGPGQARSAVIGLAVATLLLPLGTIGRAPLAVLLGILTAVLGLPFVLRDGPRVPTVAALPEVQQLAAAVPARGAVMDFAASLQPGWWLVRALVAAALVVGVFGGGWFPILVVGALALPVSVWLGHRARRDRRWLWLVVPLNGLAAAILLGAVSFWTPGFESPSPVAYSEPSPSGLWQNGELIRDIRPVDASGNPLSEVYLFDQDGRPINTSILGEDCHPGLSDPGVPIDPASPYPRGTVEYSGAMEGACVFVPPGPLVVAVPSGPPPAPSVLPTAPTSAPESAATSPPGTTVPGPPTTPLPAPPTG